MSSSYKISPDLQKEILASILGGIYVMLSNQMDDFISIIGYVLIGWYIFWDAVLIDLVLHPWHNQPNIYMLYVIVDVATFAYFFFSTYISKVFKNRAFNLVAQFLIVWYLAYSLVDIFIPAQYAPNNSSAIFNVLMFFLSSLTAIMIIYSEVHKYIDPDAKFK